MILYTVKVYTILNINKVPSQQKPVQSQKITLEQRSNDHCSITLFCNIVPRALYLFFEMRTARHRPHFVKEIKGPGDEVGYFADFEQVFAGWV